MSKRKNKIYIPFGYENKQVEISEKRLLEILVNCGRAVEENKSIEAALEYIGSVEKKLHSLLKKILPKKNKNSQQPALFFSEKPTNELAVGERKFKVPYVHLLKIAMHLKYKVRFFYENLELPPPPTDFRRLSSHNAQRIFPIKLAQFWCTVREKQLWTKEYITKYYSKFEVQFVGSLREDYNNLVKKNKGGLISEKDVDVFAKKIVARIRNDFFIDENVFDKLKIRNRLHLLEETISSKNVLFFSSIKEVNVAGKEDKEIKINEMRGFAIADKIAPVIAYNKSEKTASKCFTVLHELTHLYLGSSTVSGKKNDKKDFQNNENVSQYLNDDYIVEKTNIENICNRTAEEFILPEKLFTDRLEEYQEKNKQPPTYADVHLFKKACKELALKNSTSVSAIAYRLSHLGKVEDNVLQSFWKDLRTNVATQENNESNIKPKTSPKKNKPEEKDRDEIAKTLLKVGGFYLAHLVLDASNNGRAGDDEVKQVLNIESTHNLSSLNKHIIRRDTHVTSLAAKFNQQKNASLA